MFTQRFSRPVTPGVKNVLQNRKRSTLPAVDADLDKALDEFVTDKPPSIMKEEKR
jgi:hypothetical protein